VLGVRVINCQCPTCLIPSVESVTLVGNIPYCDLLPKPLKKLVASQYTGVAEQNTS
jgi:hypothetical protein